MWQVAARVEPDGKPNGLLRLAIVTARNLAISETRRARGETAVDTVHDRATVDVPDVRRTGGDPFLREHVRRCREQLPTKPAAALTARLESAGVVSDRELAAGVGMRPNTFLQNITRARRWLAECLKRAGVDLELELS